MKNINNFILEKLNLSKTKNIVDLDDLNGDKIVLYDSTADFEEEDDESYMWDDCNEELSRINNEYSGFIAFKFNSIMKSKEIADKKHQDVEPYEVQEVLTDITERIMDGKDAGYAVRLVGGHMEIDCINSGNRSTYYIYALTSEGYDRVSSYWEGDEEEPNIDFLYTDENEKYITAINGKYM